MSHRRIMVSDFEDVDSGSGDVAHDERELFLLTGAEDEDNLAWQLFAEIDGAVHLARDSGITVLVGWQYEDITYPFSIRELRELARRMEAVEDDLRSREGD